MESSACRPRTADPAARRGRRTGPSRRTGPAIPPAEHALWDTLFARQSEHAARPRDRRLPARAGRACACRGRASPTSRSCRERLQRLTGWQVVAVPGLVPDEVFFDHLANRRFVAGRFIRRPDQIDYLQEPDVFHDVFGHVPLLADPVFADYMQAYGEGGLRALRLRGPGPAGPALLVHGGVRPDPRAARPRSSTAPASSPATASRSSPWTIPRPTASASTWSG